MNGQFDELTKSISQSVTRRAALKKFAVGLTGVALVCLGLATRAEAQMSEVCLKHWGQVLSFVIWAAVAVEQPPIGCVVAGLYACAARNAQWLC